MEGALRFGLKRDRWIPGFQVPFSWDDNGKDDMHTVWKFLCILHQDMAEQPVHRNSGRPIFSPLWSLDEAYSEHLGAWKEVIFLPALQMLCP